MANEPRAPKIAKLGVAPPVAKKHAHEVAFGAVEGELRGENPSTQLKYLTDEYFWLRDDGRKNEKVISHLCKENEYAEAQLEPLASLQGFIASELNGLLKEADISAPAKWGQWQYYKRTCKDKSYTVHCRKPLDAVDDTSEITLLDENILAAANSASSHTSVGAVEVSPSQNLVAFTVDCTGEEIYQAVVKECGGVELFRISDVDGAVCWGADDSVLYYIKHDEALRPYQVWRHCLSSSGPDELVFEERDALFLVSLKKTTDDAYLVVGVDSELSNESHVLLLQQPQDGFVLVEPRKPNVKYELDHRDGSFFIVTNAGGHPNFRFVKTPVASPRSENWASVSLQDSKMCIFDDGTDLSPGSPMIESVTCFKGCIILSGRANGFTKCWVVEMSGDIAANVNVVPFPDEACLCALGVNLEYSCSILRFEYSSLVHPHIDFDYVIESHELILVKQDGVPNYDPSEYRTVRVEATAIDGVRVPISLVFHESVCPEGQVTPNLPAPLFICGYGAYGLSWDPDFESSRIPLLNRGVVFALAHVRGGGEMGTSWWESGRGLQKRNSFSDFVSCLEVLHDGGWSSPDKTAIEGRSAGGLLVGVVLNMRPDLFSVALSTVPFVDVMTTMCDSSIPLVTVSTLS